MLFADTQHVASSLFHQIVLASLADRMLRGGQCHTRSVKHLLADPGVLKSALAKRIRALNAISTQCLTDPLAQLLHFTGSRDESLELVYS